MVGRSRYNEMCTRFQCLTDKDQALGEGEGMVRRRSERLKKGRKNHNGVDPDDEDRGPDNDGMES